MAGMPFTAQQLSGGGGYSRRTLMGNWHEEAAVADSLLKHAIARKAGDASAPSAAVAAQRAARLQAAEEPMQLTSSHPDGNLRFGDVVYVASADGGVALSCDAAVESRAARYIVSASSATASADFRLPTRQCWVLGRGPVAPGGAREAAAYGSVGEDDVIHYGQRIQLLMALSAVASRGGVLALRSDGGPDAVTGATARQELVAAPLPAGGGGSPFSWVLWPPSTVPSARALAAHKPVPAGAPVTIFHAAINLPLCVGDGPTARVVTAQGAAREVAVGKPSPAAAAAARPSLPPCVVWELRAAPLGCGAAPAPAVGPAGARRPVEEILGEVRERLAARGTSGARQVARMVRLFDRTKDGVLSRAELRRALDAAGAPLSAADVDALMVALDRDGSGAISAPELLRALRGGGLSARRAAIVDAVYAHVRRAAGGMTLRELAALYDAGGHPDVQGGKRSAADVAAAFVSRWDLDGDGVVTGEEWRGVHEEMSMEVDDDDFFELMMRNVWHLSGGVGWCANTTCRRVLVTHASGKQTVEEIKDDLGIGPHDIGKMRANLAAQGITDVVGIDIKGGV